MQAGKNKTSSNFTIAICLSLNIFIACMSAFAESDIDTVKLNGSASLQRRDSLYDFQDGTKQSYLEMSASQGLAIDGIKYSLLVEASQDLKSREAEFDTFQLGASFKTHEIGASLVNMSTSLGLPVSPSARNDSLKANAGVGLKVAANTEMLNWKKLSLIGAVKISKNFHEFETKKNGNINAEYVSIQSGIVGWALSDKLSISTALVHANIIIYGGKLYELVGHSQDLSYEFSPNFSLSLGHSYGSPLASARDAAGQNYELPLLDDKQSFVSLGATLSF